MEINKQRDVLIDYYDEEGTLCESVRGKMTFDEIAAHVGSAMGTECIPVIRDAKKENTEPDAYVRVKWAVGTVAFEADGPLRAVQEMEREYIEKIGWLLNHRPRNACRKMAKNNNR